MPIPINIFVSSTMKELEDERKMLSELLEQLGDGFVTIIAWVFEHDEVASNISTQQLCQEKLEESVLYMGLFWLRYGKYTVTHEHKYAKELGIARHFYVKTVDDDQRDPKLKKFIDRETKYETGVTAKWFATLDVLRESVIEAIDDWLRDWLTRPSGKIPRIFQRDSDGQHNIPADLLPAELIGRDDLLSEIQTALTSKKRVLLHGFVGMGKTAVAATLAAQQVAQGPVLWMDTGMETYHPAIQRLIEGLGGSEKDPTQVSDALKRLLDQHNIKLIVLDNVWMDGTALIQLLKTIPATLPVLVTSRNRYALASIIELGGLASSDAIKLLNAQTGRDYTTDPQVGELCAELDHNPFALRIAGEMLRVDQMRPGDLIKRIAEAPHEAKMPDDFEAGRSSLWELLDASLYVLADDERIVFQAFGVLTDPDVSPELMAELVKHLCAASADAPDAASIKIHTVLNELQRRALIDYGDDGRYTISGMAHLYAQTLIERDHPNGSRHLIAARACRDYVRATLDDLPAQDRERTNILKSLTAALATDPAGMADVLLDVIENMVIRPDAYFYTHPHTELSLTLLEKAAELAAQTEQYPLAHELNQELGYVLSTYFNRIEQAVAADQQSLECAQQLPPADRDRAVLRAKIQLATAYGDLSHHYYHAALPIKTSGGSPVELEQREQHYAAEALNGYAEAETIARETNNNLALCTVLQHRGYFIMRRAGRQPEDQRDWQAYAQAAQLFDQMIPLARQLPDMHSLIFQAYRSRVGCEASIGILNHDLDALHRAEQTLQTTRTFAAEDHNQIEGTQCIESWWEVNHSLARYWFGEAITAWSQQDAAAERLAIKDFLTQANATAQQLKTLDAEAFTAYLDTVLAQHINQLTGSLAEQKGAYQTAQDEQDIPQRNIAQTALAKAYHALAEYRAAEALKAWRDLDAPYMVQDFRDYLVDHFNYTVELKTLNPSTP